MRSIKLSDYFELRRPSYSWIRIISHKSIRNYNSCNLVKTIANTYRSINKLIHKEQKKLIFDTYFSIKYIIDIVDSNANFYFVVPSFYKNIILEKIKEIWSKCTIEVINEGIKPFSETSIQRELFCKKDDALSLQIVDKKSNEPLNQILSVMQVMDNKDRITLVFNLIPCSQTGWLDKYTKSIEKMKRKECMDKEVISFEYIFKVTFSFICDIVDMLKEVLNDSLGGNKIDNKISTYGAFMNALSVQNDEISIATKKKKDSQIINTQIAVISDSEDEVRKVNNIQSVCNSFRILDENNELMHIESKKVCNINDMNLKTKISKLSVDEVSNFIKIPGRLLLTSLGISHIKTEEVNIPKELSSGYICLGRNTYKGVKTKAYLEDDKEIGSLPLLIMGRQGGGKTIYLTNYCKNVIERGESIVHIDYIKGCEASKTIEKVVPKEKLIILDLTTEEGLQALAYNEVKFEEGMSWFKKQELSNKKTQLTNELINSINIDGEPLTPKMERFLCACTDIMYLSEDVTLKDIVRCLQDFKYREEIINNIPEELKNELDEEIRTLEELDEWSKGNKDNLPCKIGTRDSKIEGILDRITLLKKEFHMKKMFNKSPIDNLDFTKAIDNGKVILIRMPQSKFKDYAKNIITTFFITKVWCSCEIRGDKKEDLLRTHFIIDELSQCKTAESFMESKLTETRKFRLKFVLTGQYLDQLEKKTVYSLKGAGASFMLLNGSIKEDFNYFKDELDETFEYEDLKNAGQFTSLNIIQYSKGYSSFITKLPKPI